MEDVKVCERCKGEMRILDPEGGIEETGDGMMPCPDCEGAGYKEVMNHD